MEFKDYYDTRGVARDATQDEIKRAYRKLARKYHPDVSKEADAEALFKQLGEAYEVLKDPEKRAAYDQLGSSWRAGEDFRPPPDWDQGSEFHGGGFEDAEFSDFFESLFGQRADLDSVMWTYSEFVRAYPDVDTSSAVNVAGFQILKMGDIETAVALLQQNARDYPTSASTRFGLGRAYQAAGSLDRAREEYQAALDADSSYERAKSALAAIVD